MHSSSTISKTSARVSSGFQTRENIWNHEAAGQVILLFSSVWKPDGNRSPSFWNDFSKETIQNYAVLYFSHFSLKCLVCVICCIQSAFVFNYPVVSRCTKFVFQKRYELKVIYILFCHGRRKVSLPENNRGRKTLRRESSTEVYQI